MDTAHALSAAAAVVDKGWHARTTAWHAAHMHTLDR
jgi:hypothetical protein